MVPKPCLSPVEMRTRTAAGGLLPAGKASTATKITYYQSCLRFCPTEETNSKKASIQYVSYYSSFWRINNQLLPFWWKVLETKPRQTLVFDPGGFTGHLRACPFLGTWRALLCGWARLDAAIVVAKTGALWVHGGVGHHLQERTIDPYVLRSTVLSPRSQADTWSR